VKTRYSEAEVGQYIYADGNFGNDHSKAVARIIWKGNPGLTDGTLRKDHPGCVHGVAMALTVHHSSSFGYLNTDNTIINMYESCSENQIHGYNNTMCIKKHCDNGKASNPMSNVIAGIVTYSPSAPAASSGWYLPSQSEMDYAGRFITYSTDAYWTSTMTSSSPNNCYIKNGGLNKTPNTESHYYFYVFAF
jgi:hypothetical protein